MIIFTKRFIVKIILFLIVIFLPFNLFAEDKQGDNKVKNLEEVFIIEGIFCAISGFYTASPKITGITALAISPLAIAAGGSSDHLATSLTIAVGYIGIAAYNIIVPKRDNLSRQTIFARNMIALNALVITTGIVYLVTSHDKEIVRSPQNTPLNLDIAFKEGTPLLVANYRF